MDKALLQNLLLRDESASLEFKSSLEFREDISKTICAFANTVGGYLIVGVDPKKHQVIGVQNNDHQYRQIPSIISVLHPRPHYADYEMDYNDKKLIVIRTEPLPLVDVCFFKKIAYRRVGSVNEEISGGALVRFLQQRGTVSFEENKSAAKIEDLSVEKINSLLKKRGIKIEDHKPLSIPSILASLSVANNVGDFYLKNAAVLFFVTTIERYLSNAEIRIVKYRGKEKTIEARQEDFRMYDTLPELLSRSYKDVLQKAGKFGRIIDGTREEISMVPEIVLREALTNAVGHRDYFDPNGILIEIFDDRVEITNPGGLLPGQTLKNLPEMRRHRNPIIYRLLNDSQWGEGLNLGIKSMYRIMRQNKLPDPLFEDLGGMFKLTLYGLLSDKKHRPYGVISVRQGKAVEHLKKHEWLSAPVYSKMAGVSHPTGIVDLNDLAAQGVIKKVGRGRSTKYTLDRK